MAFFISPVHNETHFKSDGTLASGYKIYTYAENSTTPVATFTSSTGSSSNTNPIILNARGEPPNPIWLTGGIGYKFVYTDASDVVIATLDNIRGVNDTTTTIDSWLNYGSAPTFISTTSFSLSGDQTTVFHANRRLKISTSGGTRYATITSSTYNGTSLTTIVVSLDSGTLDVGMNSAGTVNYSIIAADNSPVPPFIDTAFKLVKNGSAFFARFLATNYTASRDITLPDKSGTLAMTSDVANASVADVNARTSTTLSVSPQSLQGILNQAASQATTSGTSKDFTGIPTWAKRVTVVFDGVSLSGTAFLMFQLGSGSPTTTGYNCFVSNTQGAGLSSASATNGFIVDGGGAAFLHYGTCTFTNLTGNTWVYSVSSGANNAGNPRATVGGGSITLAGALDRVRVTSNNGTDTFDAGSVTIIWE